jgi:hypothetical protein
VSAQPGDLGYRCPRCGADWDRPNVEDTNGRPMLVHRVTDDVLVGVCEICVSFDEWVHNAPDGGWAPTMPETQE